MYDKSQIAPPLGCDHFMVSFNVISTHHSILYYARRDGHMDAANFFVCTKRRNDPGCTLNGGPAMF
jgi:hypothetical protein